MLRTGKQNYIQRSSSAQWTVVTIYLLYLLPYVVISYYERYAMPRKGAARRLGGRSAAGLGKSR